MTFLKKIYTFVAGFGTKSSWVAQMAHSHVVAFWSLVGYVAGWVAGFWQAGLIVGGLLCIVWAIPKEAWMDTLPPESAAFWPNSKTKFIDSGLGDLTFYWIGWVAATYVASAVGMAFPY